MKNNSKEDDPRLVIPFFDNEGNITAVQGQCIKRFKDSLHYNQDSRRKH